jgi:hypothetical protein
MLEVGMHIYAVNGQTITSFNEGVELIKSTAGEFRLLVEKKLSIAIGTAYEIQRKGKMKMMFLPLLQRRRRLILPPIAAPYPKQATKIDP